MAKVLLFLALCLIIRYIKNALVTTSRLHHRKMFAYTWESLNEWLLLSSLWAKSWSDKREVAMEDGVMYTIYRVHSENQKSKLPGPTIPSLSLKLMRSTPHKQFDLLQVAQAFSGFETRCFFRGMTWYLIILYHPWLIAY